MADIQLQQFLEKIRQLNAFVALSEAHPELREALRQCNQHHEVVALAARHGFEIGRRWGDPGQPLGEPTPDPSPSQPDQPQPSDQSNLLSSACPPPGEESIATLLETGSWRLERIHSCLSSSPEGVWYDQAEFEWVMVLRGSARLQFDDEPGVRDLCAGDALLITPHRRHRVVATDPDPGTLWLALFWKDGE